MPRPVLHACIEHLQLEARIGGYEAADHALAKRERTYTAIAKLIGARSEEIALVDSATRAWQMAFYGLPLKPGDRVITSQAAYAANFIGYLHRRRRDGIEIDVAPSDATGQIDVGALEEMVDKRTALIALTHIPTNGGLVNPAQDVGRVARKHDVPFLLDACQSAGHLPLDVEKLQCDMLSATGRKFLRGPRGTGFLYVRRGFLDRLHSPMPDMHGAEWMSAGEFREREDARRFELWESNKAADIGLGVAVEYALSLGMENVWVRIQELSDRLRNGLTKTGGIILRDLGAVRSGITTFTHDHVDAETIKQRLRSENVNISVSPPNSTLLDSEARGLPPMVRASVHYYNTTEEVDRFCEMLRVVSSRPT